jgi:2-iminoacetate synthase ThiH
MEKLSTEVLVNFEKVISEEDWDKIFKEAKTLSKCTGQCTNVYSSSTVCCNNKCTYCGYQK